MLEIKYVSRYLQGSVFFNIYKHQWEGGDQHWKVKFSSQSKTFLNHMDFFLPGILVADRCSKIHCPPRNDAKCGLVTPPGACCPVCGRFELYLCRNMSFGQCYFF